MYSLNRANINTNRMNYYWCYQCQAEFKPLNCDLPLCTICTSDFCEEIHTDQAHPKAFQEPQDNNPDDALSIIYLFYHMNRHTNDNIQNQLEDTILRLQHARNLLNQIMALHNLHDDDLEDSQDFNQILNTLMENDSYKGNPPASKEIIAKLPKKLFRKVDFLLKDPTFLQCSVCKEDFIEADELIELPCKHLFHSHCILPWLNNHNSCPTCRDELPTDDKDYELMKELRKQRQNMQKGELLIA